MRAPPGAMSGGARRPGWPPQSMSRSFGSGLPLAGAGRGAPTASHPYAERTLTGHYHDLFLHGQLHGQSSRPQSAGALTGSPASPYVDVAYARGAPPASPAVEVHHHHHYYFDDEEGEADAPTQAAENGDRPAALNDDPAPETPAEPTPTSPPKPPPGQPAEPPMDPTHPAPPPPPPPPPQPAPPPPKNPQPSSPHRPPGPKLPTSAPTARQVPRRPRLHGARQSLPH